LSIHSFILDIFRIQKVKLPPFSPDINIIELVWADMKRFFRKKKLKNRQEVADRVQLFFDRHLTIEKCQVYITRIQEVKYLLNFC
jgi:transposase